MFPRIFKILTPPFKVTDTHKGLEQVSNLLYALFTGGKCIGFESIDVVSTAVSLLNIPEGTVSVLIVCEADATFTNDKSKLIRVKQFDTENTPPTVSIGMPMGELGVIEIKDFDNIKEFRAIAMDAGFTHKLNVEYYG